MGDQEVITLSSDDEDSAPVPVIRRVVSLPAAESSKQLATALSRAPRLNGNGGIIRENKKKKASRRPLEPAVRNPNLVFSVRTHGDTTSEEDDDDDKEIKVNPATITVVRVPEVLTIDDDDDEESEAEPGEGEVEVEGTQSTGEIVKPSSSVTSVTSEASVKASAGSECTTEVIEPDQNQRNELTVVPTTTSLDYLQLSKNEVNKFCKLMKSKLNPKDFKKLKDQLVKRHESLKDQPKEFHEKLAVKIASSIRKIQEGESEWKRITKLKNYMKAGEARFEILKAMEEYETSDDEVEMADRVAEKAKKIAKLEKVLAKIHKKIQELDEEEVDLFADNDHNSAFIVREKYIEKSIKVYYRLCEATKCLTQTGRPTQKKINISNMTNYPELEQAVQTFINKQNHLFAPDFADIHNIVSTNNSLHLSDEAIHKIAEDLHKVIVLQIQERRQLDTLLAFPSACDEGTRDPADDDEELARKLEENKKKGKTIKDVVDEFAELARNQTLEEEKDLDEESESEDEEEGSPGPMNSLDEEIPDPDVPLSEEYAAGPEGECLGDDEDDEDVSQPILAPLDNNDSKSTPVSDKDAASAEMSNEENKGTEDQEPEAKKIKITI